MPMLAWLLAIPDTRSAWLAIALYAATIETPVLVALGLWWLPGNSRIIGRGVLLSALTFGVVLILVNAVAPATEPFTAPSTLAFKSLAPVLSAMVWAPGLVGLVVSRFLCPAGAASRAIAIRTYRTFAIALSVFLLWAMGGLKDSTTFAHGFSIGKFKSVVRGMERSAVIERLGPGLSGVECSRHTRQQPGEEILCYAAYEGDGGWVALVRVADGIVTAADVRQED